MTTISAFILYLTIFRLSIIAAGIISIVLGYRLFCKGSNTESETGGSTTVSAKIGENQFKLANAAPGTCFALFGVIIISVMFFSGSPEMTLELINDVSKERPGSVNKDVEDRMSLTLRGDESCGLIAATKKGRYLEERGETDKAIQAYQEGVAHVALPMNYLAWLYHSKNDNDKALPLAKMAVRLMPEDANSLDTLAEIRFSAGEYPEALELMKTAAVINPQFKEKLGRFRTAAKKYKSISD